MAPPLRFSPDLSLSFLLHHVLLKTIFPFLWTAFSLYWTLLSKNFLPFLSANLSFVTPTLLSLWKTSPCSWKATHFFFFEESHAVVFWKSKDHPSVKTHFLNEVLPFFVKPLFHILVCFHHSFEKQKLLLFQTHLSSSLPSLFFFWTSLLSALPLFDPRSPSLLFFWGEPVFVCSYSGTPFFWPLFRLNHSPACIFMNSFFLPTFLFRTKTKYAQEKTTHTKPFCIKRANFFLRFLFNKKKTKWETISDEVIPGYPRGRVASLNHSNNHSHLNGRQS